MVWKSCVKETGLDRRCGELSVPGIGVLEFLIFKPAGVLIEN